MRRAWPIVIAAAVAFGLVAEWAALYRPSFAAAAAAHEKRVAIGDFVVGVGLVIGGTMCWVRRPASRFGALLVATGFAWFLGTFAASGSAGGPLVHALLSYPTGRLRDRTGMLLVAAAYALALVANVGRAGATIVLAAIVAAGATSAYLRAAGSERRARLHALVAALAFAAALAAAATAVFADGGGPIDRAVLWIYQGVILASAVGLSVDIVGGRWTESTVTGVLVELGDAHEGTLLREQLAGALGDPSLEVGYWRNEAAAFFDERGERLALPTETADREVTLVRDDGEPIAALVHRAGTLAEPGLTDAVATAVRITTSNIRLRERIREQVDQIEASRRRIVEAASVQRRELERDLREGPERRLDAVERTLAGAESEGADAAALARTLEELTTARNELRELAGGVNPTLLTEHGLAPALSELVRRASFPVELSTLPERFPRPIEAAVYFVCSEALANIAKHAPGARATIDVSHADGRLVVTVRDDGGGGATREGGSGLAGLADRVEALGGVFTVDSSPGAGTTLVADLPSSS
jgi:signal transduction histidine kinase